MKVLSKIIAFFFLCVTQVALAASGLPMLSSAVSSGEQYAQRIEAGQVNGSPELIAQALYRAGRISEVSVAQAAEYIRNAEVRVCPQGTRTLSAVVNNQLGKVARAYRTGEQCLWDRNTQLVIASASCGNIDFERSPNAAPFIAERGAQGERGFTGSQGPRGQDGSNGRDGEIRYIEGQVLNYDQGTPNRMSDRAKVEIVGQFANVAETAIITRGITRLGERYIDGSVLREGIRADRDVRVAVWNSRRGPQTLVVQVAGNCNGVLGGSAHCATASVPTTGPAGPAGPAGPPGQNGHNGGPIYTPPAPPVRGPVYTPPAEPIVQQPIAPYTPPAPPIYNEPAPPVGGTPVPGPVYTAPATPIYNGPAEPIGGN